MRCVTECVELKRLPKNARALDLGCAVGRSSFELARHCNEVIGIDYSKKFVSVATRMQKTGSIGFASAEEGEISTKETAGVPAEIKRERVQFETGDAMRLRKDLGAFDVVLMANLIDRLREPRLCLRRLPDLVKPDGQLVITSPYTWLEEYTPRANWLGGVSCGGKKLRTAEALKEILADDFKLVSRRDLPFLIREHARKFQLCVAEATTWIRV
jgi:putative 4-mercaptohistidine N1-methyltranferase